MEAMILPAGMPMPGEPESVARISVAHDLVWEAIGLINQSGDTVAVAAALKALYDAEDILRQRTQELKGGRRRDAVRADRRVRTIHDRVGRRGRR